MAGRRRWTPWIAFTCLSCSLLHAAEGKHTQGVLSLSSQDTEQYLTKIGAWSLGVVEVNVSLGKLPASMKWEDPKLKGLEIHVLGEKSFAEYQAMLIEGSLCQERMRKSKLHQGIQGGWAYKQNNNGAQIHLEWRGGQMPQTYYLVASNCGLEWFDAKDVPKLDFKLTAFVDGSHIHADEWGLLTFYIWTTCGLGMALLYFAMEARVEQKRHAGVIHAFTVALFAAYVLQVAACAFEAIHLAVYTFNGKGLRWKYTIFAADFMSEVLQGMSEHVVSMLLLFLACGWTTYSIAEAAEMSVTATSKAATISGSTGRGPTLAQALLSLRKSLAENPRLKKGLRSLTAALRSPANIFDARRVSVGSAFAITLTLLVVFLEMKGRQFHDEFSQFHDHEHWPGRTILWLRVLMWVVFLYGSLGSMEAAQSKGIKARRIEMTKLASIGSTWFLAFPAAVLIATPFLSPHLRHRFVSVFAIALQALELNHLVWLSVFSTTFKSLSSIGAPHKATALGAASSLPDRQDDIGNHVRKRARFKVAID